MSYHNKNLLVIGGTGFIGEAFSINALLHGYSVTVLAKGNKESYRRSENIEYLTADITDFDSLSSVLSNKRFTHVINLGGYINHSSFQKGGDEVIDQHYGAVKTLVQCLDWGVLECFLQVGSSDEYGQARAPQAESEEELPISPYSFGKFAATHFLQMLHRTEGFPAVICRLFLVYGPGQSPDRFIPQIILACLKDQSFPVSEGVQIRDFCYIDDIVNGLLLALEADKARGQVLNIASGIPQSVKEVVQLVVEMARGGDPKFGEIAYRKGENMTLYANTSNAKRILNWSPKIDLQTGLRLTFDYYKRGW